MREGGNGNEGTRGWVLTPRKRGGHVGWVASKGEEGEAGKSRSGGKVITRGHVKGSQRGEEGIEEDKKKIRGEGKGGEGL